MVVFSLESTRFSQQLRSDESRVEGIRIKYIEEASKLVSALQFSQHDQPWTDIIKPTKYWVKVCALGRDRTLVTGWTRRVENQRGDDTILGLWSMKIIV